MRFGETEIPIFANISINLKFGETGYDQPNRPRLSNILKEGRVRQDGPRELVEMV
jgi:hypothetical protein